MVNVSVIFASATIERVDCIKCIGTIISTDLSWENNTKVQQRLFFLRQLKKFGLRREIIV